MKIKLDNSTNIHILIFKKCFAKCSPISIISIYKFFYLKESAFHKIYLQILYLNCKNINPFACMDKIYESFFGHGYILFYHTCRLKEMDLHHAKHDTLTWSSSSRIYCFPCLIPMISASLRLSPCTYLAYMFPE